MSRELLKHSQITNYTSKYQDYLRQSSEKPFWLVNTNKLVRFYSGADGLKTGYTSEAKFCLSATAKRDNMRIIAVVMGEPNTKTRNAEVSSLLDYSFAQYTNYPILKEGDAMGKLVIERGQQRELELKAKHNYSILMKKGTAMKDIRHELLLKEDLKAPIQIEDSLSENWSFIKAIKLLKNLMWKHLFLLIKRAGGSFSNVLLEACSAKSHHILSSLSGLLLVLS